jgi:hypothetical protein
VPTSTSGRKNASKPCGRARSHLTGEANPGRADSECAATQHRRTQRWDHRQSAVCALVIPRQIKEIKTLEEKREDKTFKTLKKNKKIKKIIKPGKQTKNRTKPAPNIFVSLFGIDAPFTLQKDVHRNTSPDNRLDDANVVERLRFSCQFDSANVNSM